MNYSRRSYWFWFQIEMQFAFLSSSVFVGSRTGQTGLYPSGAEWMNLLNQGCRRINYTADRAGGEHLWKKVFSAPQVVLSSARMWKRIHWFEAIKSRNSLKSAFWTCRRDMHMLISRSSCDVIPHKMIHPRLVHHYALSPSPTFTRHRQQC